MSTGIEDPIGSLSFWAAYKPIIVVAGILVLAILIGTLIRLANTGALL